MKKVTSLFDLFRKGSMVADPAAWKRRHITVAAVAGVIMALVKTLEAYGYPLPISPEMATTLAAGVLVVADLLLIPATTDKIGLPPVGDVPPVETPVDFDSPDPRA